MPTSNSSHPVDPFNLARFRRAQDASGVYAAALAELRAGHKTGHWMWFIFPQLPLGTSSTAREYAITGRDEAMAYLADPVLGARLCESAEALLALPASRSAVAVLGSTDAMKLRSSATLFAQVSPDGSVFHQLLDRFYGGEPDMLTLDRLRASA